MYMPKVIRFDRSMKIRVTNMFEAMDGVLFSDELVVELGCPNDRPDTIARYLKHLGVDAVRFAPCRWRIAE